MLWQDQAYRPFGLGPEMDNGAVDARVSYGLRLPKRLLVAPFGTYGSGYGDRRLQVGASLGAIDTGGGNAGAGGVRGRALHGRDGAGRPPDHAVRDPAVWGTAGGGRKRQIRNSATVSGITGRQPKRDAIRAPDPEDTVRDDIDVEAPERLRDPDGHRGRHPQDAVRPHPVVEHHVERDHPRRQNRRGHPMPTSRRSGSWWV